MRIIVDASGTVLMYSDMGQPTPDVGPVQPPAPVLTVDQKLSRIGLSVALLAPAIQAVIQAVPAPPAQQDSPA
jgi:hypothetical protein